MRSSDEGRVNFERSGSTTRLLQIRRLSGEENAWIVARIVFVESASRLACDATVRLQVTTRSRRGTLR